MKKKTKRSLISGAQAFFASRRGDVMVVMCGLAIYGALVGVAITASSIWFDEAFSAYIVRYNFWEIAQYAAVDVHPPLYYWVLSLWTQLFGTTELAFRSLSAVFGGVVILLGFVLSKKLFGRRAAWLTVLLLAISPTLVRLGQEARMYTMVAAIALAGTLLLLRAIKTNRGRDWALYAITLAVGMWTHYFTALVWLAHWVWRWLMLRRDGLAGKRLARSFFTKQWVMAHALAVTLFAPWLLAMIQQLATIQQGFWIGPVGVDTPLSYLSSVWFYLETSHMQGWFALWLFVIIAMIVSCAIAMYRSSKPAQRTSFWLLLVLSLAPVALLFVVSMPPLRPAFVERYVVPSTVFMGMFTAVVVAYRLPQFKRLTQVGVIVVLIAASAVGISKVYYYGNYNKNSHVSIQTRQLVEAIRHKAAPGQPLIATTPWVYYEASFYDSAEHPIYFLDSTAENYKYGSLKMLQDDDKHKITDLASFMRQHPVVWYFGSTQSANIGTPSDIDGWQRLQSVQVTDPIDHKTDFKASQLRLSGDVE